MKVWVALQVIDDDDDLQTFAGGWVELPDGEYAREAQLQWRLASGGLVVGPIFDFASRGPRGIGIGRGEPS